MSKQIIEFKLENRSNFRESKFPVLYGKCEETPNKENNLWFITFNRVFWEKSWGEWDKPFPREDHTFLIDEKYATPHYMNLFGTDVLKWSEIAQKIFVGSWCHRYETLWKDVPVFENGSTKYGYCRTQPTTNNPHSLIVDRELWYVAFITSTFIVDHICATPDFIDRMGYDMFKWLIICWCHLEHEVVWEDLKTGTLDGGYVRANEFSLDSPYIPPTLEDTKRRIDNYEIVVNAYKERRKRNEPEWHTLSNPYKANLLKKIGNEIIGYSAMPEQKRC